MNKIFFSYLRKKIYRFNENIDFKEKKSMLNLC